MPVAVQNYRTIVAAKGEPDAVSPSLPSTTQMHRDYGRGTHRDKASKQQLLTPCEGQAADRNGFLVRVKDLHHYAAVFLRGRAKQQNNIMLEARLLGNPHPGRS
jgi:hypothetical protein